MQSTLLSPEFELLRSCYSVNPSTNLKNSNRREQTINELLFKNLVIRHRVAPIVFFNLKDDPILSKELREWLKKMTEHVQVASLKSLQMMLKIQKELNQKKVQGVFLKGIPLAEMYYGDVGLRESIDIDLWVEPKGFVEIFSWIKSIGYNSKLNIEKMNEHQVAYIQKTDHHHSLITNRSDFPREIELHWKIKGSSSAFDLSSDRIQLANWSSGEMSLSVLGHIDQFIYLCVHGTEHAWFRLKWLFDLPQLIEKTEFDWAKVKNRAIELNSLAHVEISFLVLRNILDLGIPSPIMDEIIPEKYNRQLEYIYAVMGSEKGINEADRNRLRHVIFLWSLNKKKVDVSMFLKYLTSPGDWKFFPLPQNLFLLYFPLRPILWLIRRLINH